MSLRFKGVGLALLAMLVALPRGGMAEPSAPERAIAEQLFERARAQLDVNEVGGACESFAESQRLDPGTGTMLNLAACHQREGKLASAWVEFREAVTALHRENRPDRLRYALDHLAEIRPKLAFLTLMVPEAPLGHAPVVRLDGRELGLAAWNVSIPVDAGWHEAVAESACGGRWRATVKVRSGVDRVISIPACVASTGISIRDEDDAEPESRPTVVNESGGTDAPRGRRVAGLVLGGLGIGALAVGGFFGVRAAGLWGNRNEACPMDVCTPEGVRFGERADSAATVATWTIGGGLVALGTAGLFLLWPESAPSKKTSQKAPTITAMVLDGKTGVCVEGVF